MKREFSFSLFPPFHFGPLAQLFPPACSPSPSLPLPGPAQSAVATVATLSLPLYHRQPGPTWQRQPPPPPSRTRTVMENRRPRPRSIVGASSPRPAFKKGAGTIHRLPLLPSPLHFHSRSRTHRAAASHRRARPPPVVVRRTRSLTAFGFAVVSFPMISFPSPCNEFGNRGL
jgi:hypothetical protein